MMDGAGDTVTKSKDIGAKDRREQPPPRHHIPNQSLFKVWVSWCSFNIPKMKK